MYTKVVCEKIFYAQNFLIGRASTEIKFADIFVYPPTGGVHFMLLTLKFPSLIILSKQMRGKQYICLGKLSFGIY